MTHNSRNLAQCLCALLLSLTGCAAETEDDHLVLADMAPVRGVLSSAAPGSPEIWGKLATMPQDVRDAYFKQAVTEVATTADGIHYQWYAGSAGSGVLHVMADGTRYIYGAIVEAWAEQDYERGPLGYPQSDPQSTGGEGYEQEFQPDLYGPGADPDCLSKVRHYLRAASASATAQAAEVREYLDSNHPDQPVSTPQQLSSMQGVPLDPAAREIAGGPLYAYWCGPLPKEFTDPTYVPPPDTTPVLP